VKLVGESRFFETLLRDYPYAPSIVLCRVPELELLSQIVPNPPVLDHCCGDGLIASLAFAGVQIDAGIDINRRQLARAVARGSHKEVRWGDAGVRLPFEDASFATVFNNSGIEHIRNLGKALAEINRVLVPGGSLYLSVLNSRYFERWPLSPDAAARYRAFQPFCHAFSESGWSDALVNAGFARPTFRDYLGEQGSKSLAFLDYVYSAQYFRKAIPLRLAFQRVVPRAWLRDHWRRRLGGLVWDAAPGTGSGFLIATRKLG
jgi:SAM-dependent methyltransferase